LFFPNFFSFTKAAENKFKTFASGSREWEKREGKCVTPDTLALHFATHVFRFKHSWIPEMFFKSLISGTEEFSRQNSFHAWWSLETSVAGHFQVIYNNLSSACCYCIDY
jgi:hypothetical protein